MPAARALRPLGALLLVGALTSSGQELPTAAGAFSGQLLVAACDADMLPAAYLGGTLGPAVGPDQLAVIRLDGPLSKLRAATVPVSNSVAGPPATVAVTPDGRFAIVIETRGPRPANATHLADLPEGHLLTVVDLADPGHPRIVQTVQGPEHPLSVTINARGTLVAVAHSAGSARPAPPLALYRLREGRLSAAITPAIPGFTAGQSLTSAQFHPTRDTLALVYESPAKLAFVDVREQQGTDAQQDTLTLAPWGNDVAVDQSVYTAIFTRDGQFVLLNAMLPFVRGTVSSVRVGAPIAPGGQPDGKPHHFLVSHVLTGIFPEGLTVSPDAHWVVTSNLENSTWPLDDPRQGFFSSLTLIRLDPQTGQLTRVGDFPFDGMLPEAPVFDDSSRFLAVTNYSQFRNPAGGGSIDFWRVSTDAFEPERAELVKLQESVPVPRGPQSMVIVRNRRRQGTPANPAPAP